MTRITAVTTAMALATFAACAASPADRELGVCLHRSTEEILDASLGAARIFQSIGVKVNWLRPPACNQASDFIQIDLCYESPKSYPATSLAYAYPYAGSRIVILMDHVKATARPGRERSRLTYVLVHEITHVLQGISRHSQTGIMKAHWTDWDQYDISRSALSFAPEDVELIRYGLDARRARQATVRTTDAPITPTDFHMPGLAPMSITIPNTTAVRMPSETFKN
jgi:hypothetical protein